MKRCVNFREGCQGRTSSYKIHYCNDCYNAWQVGGATQVSADIAARNKPAHVCVGTEQLAAKDIEIAKLQEQVAEYAAFKAEVVEVYTSRFAGEVLPPDPARLVQRIKMDHVVANTARTAMSRDGKSPEKGTPLDQRCRLTVQWLKQLDARLKFRSARCPQIGDYVPHPSASAKPTKAVDNQLNRIESLAKQAASRSVFWPCLVAVIIYAILFG